MIDAPVNFLGEFLLWVADDVDLDLGRLFLAPRVMVHGCSFRFFSGSFGLSERSDIPSVVPLTPITRSLILQMLIEHGKELLTTDEIDMVKRHTIWLLRDIHSFTT